MKLLTLNFLTCAVKSCRNAATQSTHIQQPTTSADSPDDPDEQPKGSSFPLHLSEVELIAVELDFNELFWRNILPRLELPAMASVLNEAGLRLPEPFASRAAQPQPVPPSKDGGGDVQMEGVEGADGESELKPFKLGGEAGEEEVSEEVLRKLHKLLLETQVQEGWLVCGRCGHKYAVKEGIPNFLLPPHLVG